MKPLKGKVMIVTGGTSGIGQAAARRELHHGARVVITGRKEEKGSKALVALDDASASYVPHDVTSPESWQEVVTSTVDRHGGSPRWPHSSWPPCRVRVNSVHPGMTLTPMTAESAGLVEGEGNYPGCAMGRVGTADELAGAIVHLLSYDASYTTGAEVAIDGGWSAGWLPRVLLGDEMAAQLF